MGITRGHLRVLGFKKDKQDNLVYKVTDTEKLILGKGKTVIFHTYTRDNKDIVLPLVHLNYTTRNEMYYFLRSLKAGEYFRLEEQLD